MRMAPQNADSESMQVQELPVPLPDPQKPGSSEPEPRDETVSEGSIDRIPVRLWVMHGAVMFGREFCYAMETALVTPILLQIGECGCPGSEQARHAGCVRHMGSSVLGRPGDVRPGLFSLHPAPTASPPVLNWGSGGGGPWVLMQNQGFG